MKKHLNKMQEYDKRMGVPQFEGWQEREIEAHKKSQIEQLILHNVVVPKGTLCETCQDKGQYYAGILIGYVNCPDCNE